MIEAPPMTPQCRARSWRWEIPRHGSLAACSMVTPLSAPQSLDAGGPPGCRLAWCSCSVGLRSKLELVVLRWGLRWVSCVVGMTIGKVSPGWNYSIIIAAQMHV